MGLLPGHACVEWESIKVLQCLLLMLSFFHDPVVGGALPSTPLVCVGAGSLQDRLAVLLAALAVIAVLVFFCDCGSLCVLAVGVPLQCFRLRHGRLLFLSSGVMPLSGVALMGGGPRSWPWIARWIIWPCLVAGA